MDESDLMRQHCSEMKTWNFAKFANFLVEIKSGKKILVFPMLWF
ncbi:hypothetical protein MTR67_008970 [Solanum verrucosum]|uniref:Uncharacterized protein n=1 Tax=Solanum verrucosum TaxID=315347 RepID=A0AAF0Q691_SOLVR|nr:hypothetical protein MTR67_008970 [Solanum verrucosum]